METQKLAKIHIYIHAGSYGEFAEYQRKNPDYNCEMIFDDTSLRGRPEAQVLRIGTYDEKWNHQGIEEGIMIAEGVWGREGSTNIENESDQDEDITSYGVN